MTARKHVLSPTLRGIRTLGGVCTARQLGEHLDVPHTTAAQRLARYESEGYVCRDFAPPDSPAAYVWRPAR